jgi:hypothetical protein
MTCPVPAWELRHPDNLMESPVVVDVVGEHGYVWSAAGKSWTTYTNARLLTTSSESQRRCPQAATGTSRDRVCRWLHWRHVRASLYRSLRFAFNTLIASLRCEEPMCSQRHPHRPLPTGSHARTGTRYNGMQGGTRGPLPDLHHATMFAPPAVRHGAQQVSLLQDGQ